MPSRNYQSALSQLTWRMPEPAGLEFSIETVFDPQLATLSAAVFKAGKAETPDGLSPLEQARLLLRAAAEVEHSLMAQYLYAACSLNHPSSKEILLVAKQEMGHLVTVQNLLLQVRADPSFERDNAQATSPTSPVLFKLEPLTKGSLAKYVVTEMPDPAQLNAQEQTEIDPVIQLANMTDHTIIYRVGSIYARLYWLFLEKDSPLPPALADGDSALFPLGSHLDDADLAPAAELQTRQAISTEWQAGTVKDMIVAPTPDRAAALKAIFRVAAQGEGAPDAPNSHFRRFWALYRNFDSLPAGAFLPLPVNPDEAPGWSALFNLRYQILLTLLNAAMRIDRGPRRSHVTGWALDEMRDGVGTLSRRLATRGIGPPFALPHDPYPNTVTELSALLKAQSDRSRKLVDALLADPDTKPDESIELKAIQQMDHDRIL